MAAPFDRPPLAEPFASVLARYERGRYLDAWGEAQRAGAPEAWPGIEPRILGGRLLTRLGAPRRAALLFHRVFREHPDHPDAQYYHVARVHERRGAWAAWQERRRLAPPAETGGAALGDYHGQCALLLAALRDFDAAEERLALARAASPGRPYWHTERIAVLLYQDRHDDALRAADAGLAEDDGYPPTVLSAAHAYLLGERQADAITLLERAAARGQSAEASELHARLLLKLRRLDEAEAALAQWDRLTPLREEAPASRIAAMRAELALRRRDYAGAMAYLERVTHPYFKGIATNLRAGIEERREVAPRRVELAVPYVQQHQRTCSPATLTAISRFWDRPAEHLAVAEEICYDGTPSHSERRWADEHGWATREFRVEWPAAVALLDRGVPFTLTLRGATAGHLVAVTGYDEATRVLLTRDPASPEPGEINAVGLLAERHVDGPRGMAMVPAARPDLLDGLDLPEAELYDLHHRLWLALEHHDRAVAVELRSRMVAAAPDHRLTLLARRALAGHDANPHEDRAAIDALLDRYPGEPSLLLARLQSLRHVGTRDERIAWLADAAQRAGADPALLVEYAIELATDERRLGRAEWLLRRALRRRPDDPYTLHQLAGLRARGGDLAGAAELHRVAANLDEVRDTYAQAYFVDCRLRGRSEDGLAFLRRRFDRLGARHGEPATTLFTALEAMERTLEAFEVLEEAVRRRPDDGELRLFAAERCARHGRVADAAAHRDAGAGRVGRVRWLADAARAARLEGDRVHALACWREILATQPLNLEAHGAVAALLSETGAPQDAAEHLRRQCVAFPHHAGLHHLLYRWTSGEPAALREPVLRTLAAIDPADGWTLRELALNLDAQGRAAEALASAQAALEVDSADATGHAVLGHLLAGQGRLTEAEAAYRAALARSVDATHAIYGLLDVCGDRLERRPEALAYVEAQVRDQPVSGDGLLAFRQAARGVLTPDELLEALRRLHAARPDLWQAWSALVQHLAEMGSTVEALALAVEGAVRFPAVVPLRLDLSRVRRTRLEVSERIVELERCRDLDPEAVVPILELADAYAQAGRVADAERWLEGAIRRLPLAVALRGTLAAILHGHGEHEKAIAIVTEALRVEPGYEWGWQRLAEWSEGRGEASVALDLAQAFAEQRPGESRAWVRLADLQVAAGRSEAALASADRAIAADPRNPGGHDLRAAALAQLHRFHEAEAACHPAVFGTDVPLVLRGREAWVDALRGDLTAAFRKMRAALVLHPDYRWGWYRLLEWSANAGRLDQAIEAAERLAWLDADSVEPLAWVGDLRRRRGELTLAKAAFRRAMQLQPDHLFAGFSYFAVLCHEHALDDARRTIEILRPHAPWGRLRVAELTLAAAGGDRDAAFAAFRDLCTRTDATDDDLAAAADTLADAGWGEPAEWMLRESTTAARWHPAVPRTWVRMRQRRGRSTTRPLRWLTGLGAPGREAVYAILDGLGDRAREAGGRSGATTLTGIWDLWRVRSVCAPWRAADDRYWGKVGYALICRGRPGPVVRWMRDWRDRRGVEAWMLQNLTLALLLARRDDEARAVLRHIAGAMVPAAPVNPLPRLWCALGACLDGDLALAGQLLYATPEDTLQPQDRPLRRLAVAVLDVLRDSPGRAALTPERRAAIRSGLDAAPPRTADERLVHLAAARVARHARSPGMRLRAWSRMHLTGRLAWRVLVAVLAIRLVTLLFEQAPGGS